MAVVVVPGLDPRPAIRHTAGQRQQQQTKAVLRQRSFHQSFPGNRARLRELAAQHREADRRRVYSGQPTRFAAMCYSAPASVNQEHELRYWATAVEPSLEDLHAAVEAMGPIADKVRKYLQQGG